VVSVSPNIHYPSWNLIHLCVGTQVCHLKKGAASVKNLAQFKKTKSNRNVFTGSPCLGKTAGNKRGLLFPQPKKATPTESRTKSAWTALGLGITQTEEVAIPEQNADEEETPKISLGKKSNLDAPGNNPFVNLVASERGDSVDSSSDDDDDQNGKIESLISNSSSCCDKERTISINSFKVKN